MINIPATKVAIIGPTYGTMLKTAHKSAIIKAFSTPKIKKTIKYKTKIMNNEPRAIFIKAITTINSKKLFI